MSRRKREQERIARRDARKQAGAVNLPSPPSPQTNDEPDDIFIPLFFSAKDDGEIILWKELVRYQQSNGWLSTGLKTLLTELKDKYGTPLGNLRLDDTGFVELGSVNLEDGVPPMTDELKKRAIAAGENVWDEFYPEVAERAVAYEQHLLNVIADQTAVSNYFSEFTEEEMDIKMMGLEGTTEVGKSTDDLLKFLLNQAAEKLAVGGNPAVLGISTDEGAMAIVPYTMPHEKYRFARCLSHVARAVSAQHVLMTVDTFLTDKAGNRSEALYGLMWNSDGTGRGCHIAYTRESDGTVTLQEPSAVSDVHQGNMVIRWDNKRDELSELGLAAAAD